MPATVAQLGTPKVETDGNVVTGSVSPAAGSLVLAAIIIARDGTEGGSPPTDAITVAGVGADTVTKLGTVVYGTRRRAWLYCLSGTLSTGTVTVDYTGPDDATSAVGVIVSLAEVTGWSSAPGAGSAQTASGTSGTATVTITGTADSDDATYAMVATEDDFNPTWEAAYAELSDTSETTNARRLTTAWDDTHDQSPSATFTTTAWGTIGILLQGIDIGVTGTLAETQANQTGEALGQPAAPVSTNTERIWTEPSNGFTSLEVDVQVNVTDWDVGYFYAYQFGFGVEGELNGYIGIQTKVSGLDGTPPGARFSLWDSLEARGPGRVATFGAGEGGEGYTVTIPFAWEEGITYHLTVRQMPRSGRLHGARWWGGWIDGNFIGQIRVPDDTRGSGWWTVQWTEFYTSATTCGQIPPSEVLWSPPLADGVPPLTSNFNVGTVGCPGSSNVDIGGSVSRERMRWS